MASLIDTIKKDPRLKGISIRTDNLADAVAYLDACDNCLKCKSLSECKNSAKGMTPVLGDNGISYKPCDIAVKELALSNVNHTFASNYLRDANFSSFDTSTEARAKALQYAEKFVLKPNTKGLYLYGNFGTGKTYFLSALANELANKGIKSIIVFMPDLSRYLKNSINDDSLESKVTLLKEIPVLMLDDLGGEMMTSWLRDEIIAPIIQYRLVNELPVFVTSNLNYDAMRDHLAQTRDDVDQMKSNRILERLKNLTKRVLFDEEFKD